MKKILSFSFLTLIIMEGISFAQTAAPSLPKVDSGDTAWILISAALVMLMIPGLALFYGGMVR
jgi:Amt family ammonium transporter